MFATIDSQVFTIGFAGPDSREMIVTKVTCLIPQFYAVTITNAAGESMMSARMKFTLTDLAFISVFRTSFTIERRFFCHDKRFCCHDK